MAETADDRLRQFIERIENREEAKRDLALDIREIYAEAKAVGYDTKVMRHIVGLRRQTPDSRREMETITDIYKSALGLD